MTKEMLSAFKQENVTWHNKLTNRKIRHTNGDIRTVQIMMYPIKTNNDIRLGAIYRDITKEIESEEELKKSKIIAEESARLKTAFLANLSHEIRTPLNGILGFLQLLIDSKKDLTTKSTYTEIIKNSSNQLLGIMDDIIDLSRIQSGDYKSNEKEIIINDELNKTCSRYTEIAKEKQLRFIKKIYNMEGLSKIIVEWDTIKEILAKLLDNAFKFTQEGCIETGYNILPENNFIKFYVKDTGIGISKENQALIFDRFRQLDITPTRKYGGMGIGLSIVKAFVEKIGGKIWVKSKENIGSTFYFSIPYKTTKPENIHQDSIIKNQASVKYNWENKKILIADDISFNRFLLKEILKKTYAEILNASNGKEAIDVFKQTSDIDLVLMDIKMPVIDGIEATKEIRKIDKTIPLIAQSAYNSTENKNEMIKAGCNDFIEKPIIKEELLLLIDKYFVGKG